MEIRDLRASPLIEMATEGKRRTPWWLAYLIVAIAVIGILGIAIGVPQSMLGFSDSSVMKQLFEPLSSGLTILLIFLWVRLVEGRGFTSLGFRGGRGLVRFVVGLLIGMAMMVAVVGIATLMGGFSFNASPDHGSLGSTAIVIALALVLAVVVQATGEEILMRGFVLQSNALALPGVVALLLPGIYFALLHMAGGFEPIAFLDIFVFATFAALVALREGSLWLIAGIHTGWNWAQGNLLGAPVSGQLPHDATIFTITPTPGASNLVTGGSFGPEASVIALVVWIIATAIAFRYFRSPATGAERSAAGVAA